MIFVLRLFWSNGQVFLFKQLHVLSAVHFLGNKIFASWEFKMVLLFHIQLYMWSFWWGGKYFFIRFRNIFPMLVFMFLLYSGLKQIMFLLRCFFFLLVEFVRDFFLVEIKSSLIIDNEWLDSVLCILIIFFLVRAISWIF